MPLPGGKEAVALAVSEHGNHGRRVAEEDPGV